MQKFELMRFMFGAQVDEYDFHKTGFDEAILDKKNSLAGFCTVLRAGTFGLFEDTSLMTFIDQPLSLNMVARKCTVAEARTRGAGRQDGEL
jgi:hypothetical protein